MRRTDNTLKSTKMLLVHPKLKQLLSDHIDHIAIALLNFSLLFLFALFLGTFLSFFFPLLLTVLPLRATTIGSVIVG